MKVTCRTSMTKRGILIKNRTVELTQMEISLRKHHMSSLLTGVMKTAIRLVKMKTHRVRKDQMRTRKPLILKRFTRTRINSKKVKDHLEGRSSKLVSRQCRLLSPMIFLACLHMHARIVVYTTISVLYNASVVSGSAMVEAKTSSEATFSGIW